MDQSLYIEILDKTLLPFVENVYLDEHRLMADNDPKHTSRATVKFLEDNSIYWWRTPAEFPDLNPIENLWHIKPKRKEELIDGILKFWDTVDVAKCSRYIRHLIKVIPKVIELEGAATGY